MKDHEMIQLATPAVQGEPVAYLREDQLRKVQRMGPMLGEIADSPRVDRVPVYAATCCDHNSKKSEGA